MILPTSANIAVRCLECGKSEVNKLSVFEFSGNSSVTKKCSCDEKIISIYTKDKRNYWVKYYCFICNSLHVCKLKITEIWAPGGERGRYLYCEETSQVVGYIGNEKWVKEKMEKEEPHSLADIAEQMGFTQFFKNAEVMYEILEHIYQIAEDGNLLCACGNYNIEIEIFPGHLEMMCEECGSKERIMAETENDLRIILPYTEIKLSAKEFTERNLKK